jgi:hypothetical protein
LVKEKFPQTTHGIFKVRFDSKWTKTTNDKVSWIEIDYYEITTFVDFQLSLDQDVCGE